MWWILRGAWLHAFARSWWNQWKDTTKSAHSFWKDTEQFLSSFRWELFTILASFDKVSTRIFPGFSCISRKIYSSTTPPLMVPFISVATVQEPVEVDSNQHSELIFTYMQYIRLGCGRIVAGYSRLNAKEREHREIRTLYLQLTNWQLTPLDHVHLSKHVTMYLSIWSFISERQIISWSLRDFFRLINIDQTEQYLAMIVVKDTKDNRSYWSSTASFILSMGRQMIEQSGCWSCLERKGERGRQRNWIYDSSAFVCEQNDDADDTFDFF